MAISEKNIPELRRRFESDDPLLKDAEIEYLRHCTSAIEWRNMLDAKAARRSGAVISITEGRTEAQIAQEYHARMLHLLNQITEVLNEAKQKHGMQISFGYAPPNAFGIQTLASLEIIKKLC
jgi:hypothetical protein